MKKLLAIVVLGLFVNSSVDAYSGRKAEAKGYIYVGVSKLDFCKNTLNYPCADTKKKKKNKKNKYANQYYYDGKNYEIISTDDFRFYLFKNVTVPAWKAGFMGTNGYGDGTLISMHDSMDAAKKYMERDKSGFFIKEKEKKRKALAEKKKKEEKEKKKKEKKANSFWNFNKKKKTVQTIPADEDPKITKAKKACRDLGFKPRSERFTDCALKLVMLDFERTTTVKNEPQVIINKNVSDTNIFDELGVLFRQQGIIQDTTRPANTRTNMRCTTTKTGFGQVVTNCR